MCGIAGDIRFDDSCADLAALIRMSSTLSRRGPDAQGLWHQGRAAFAHRRLSIIDLSTHAQQPMIDAQLGLTLVFNGCIYNYRLLRTELIALGYRFFSEGDTEVILKAYHAWGCACVERFEGMFAFALLEHKSGRLILARDRFGIKPLYLASQPDGLRFASTLPALLAGGNIDTTIDDVALHHYLSWHAVVPPPNTILRGIKKCPAATVVIFDRQGHRKDWRYWDMDFTPDPELAQCPRGAREELLEDALCAAVKKRMVADVPVGVLLSGGVDSSLMVALLSELGQERLQTFSIGFPAQAGESGDEFIYSDQVARQFGTQHHRLAIDSAQLLNALPATINAMSEPMASADNVAFYLLSAYVAQQVKVVQSGQGADEIFAGYHWHPKIHHVSDPLSAFIAAYFDRDHREFSDMVEPQWVSRDFSRERVAREFENNSDLPALHQSLRLESLLMLADDPVKRVDNMTMAWGLEARTPFLDHQLAELAARLPLEDKIDTRSAQGGKALLKSIARRKLPAAVIDRPKGYFPVPMLKYLAGPTLEMATEALTNRAARERGLFRPEYINKLLADPAAHLTPLNGSKLWQVALLELWLQTHLT
jgi:asparagine synthase (glutamine-hydrolysing)